MIKVIDSSIFFSCYPDTEDHVLEEGGVLWVNPFEESNCWVPRYILESQRQKLAIRLHDFLQTVGFFQQGTEDETAYITFWDDRQFYPEVLFLTPSQGSYPQVRPVGGTEGKFFFVPPEPFCDVGTGDRIEFWGTYAENCGGS